MCGLRTRPRADIDPPRFFPPSNCHWGEGAYRLAALGATPCWLWRPRRNTTRSAGCGLLLPMSHVAWSLRRTHDVLCKNSRTDREPVYTGVDSRWLKEPYISRDQDSPRRGGILRLAAACQIFRTIALFSDKNGKMVRPASVYIVRSRALHRSKISFMQSELSLQVRSWTLWISAVSILALSMRIPCPKRGAKVPRFVFCQPATTVLKNNLCEKLALRLAQSVFSRYSLTAYRIVFLGHFKNVSCTCWCSFRLLSVDFHIDLSDIIMLTQSGNPSQRLATIATCIECTVLFVRIAAYHANK